MKIIESSRSPNFFLFAKFNAWFSGLCAIDILLFSQSLPSLIGFAHSEFYVSLAVFLAIFSMRLFWIGKSQRVYSVEAWSIVAGDVLWVLASIVLVASYEGLTLVGIGLILVIAAAVFTFALGQAKGLLQTSQVSV